MYKFILLALLLLIGRPVIVRSQGPELQQLILNVEKLNQLRSILNNMYKGYTILSNGYNTIKDLAEGNFNLHQLFLDKLLEVNPVIKNGQRTIEIIQMQIQLVKEYKSAFSRFRLSGLLTGEELDYLQKVYNNLVDKSLQNLDELIMVVTSGQLRMNDAERLDAIDRIHASIEDKLRFLRYFNNKNTLLLAQKRTNLNETGKLQELYHSNN